MLNGHAEKRSFEPHQGMPRSLVDRCVSGIKANEECIGSLIEDSLALCTALTPIIGYDAAANIAKEAFSTRKTVRQVSREHKVLPER